MDGQDKRVTTAASEGWRRHAGGKLSHWGDHIGKGQQGDGWHDDGEGWHDDGWRDDGKG